MIKGKLKTRILRGLTSVLACFMSVLLVGTGLALQSEALISLYIGASTYKITESDTANEDTQYIKSSYGVQSDNTYETMLADIYQQVISEEEEGAVLLINNGNALPLDSKENRITLFGRSSADPLYSCSGSQSFITGEFNGDSSLCVEFHEEFTQAGFELNETLYQAYESSPTKRLIPGRESKETNIGEEDISFYTEALKQSWANDYNDAAIVVLSRYGGEGTDMLLDTQDDDGTQKHQLSLYKSERDLLDMIKNQSFEKIIVLLNSPYPMEVNWFSDYDVDSCLWIACPGVTGLVGVANIISGKANPSGKLTDTYATSALSSPALVNSVGNTGLFVNADEVNAYTSSGQAAGTPYMGYTDFTVQLENIYFGYRYYETRYEDLILKQGGADSSQGSIDGQPWNYAKEMSYPFGYGLSYTTFSQDLIDVAYDPGTDKYTLNVLATNTGNVDGKSVIQVYAQTPYGEYEKQNNVEKASVSLVGFGKTKLLKANQSETVKVEVDRYLLASYDDNKAKGYILSEGDYYLAIGDDAHDALNNILAAKNANGMFDQDGNAVPGDKSKAYSFSNSALDTQSYKISKNGVAVTNQFDDCDINYWDTTKVTYLSRQDWEGTYPAEAPEIVCTPDMMKILNNELYEKPEDSPSVESFTQGADNGISFVMMRDVPYDDPLWETYLDQITLEEMAANATDNFGIPGNTSVAKPTTAIGDGTNGFRGSYAYGDKRYSAQYASSGILASTFNKDLMRNRAKSLSEEALFSGSAFEASAGAPIAFGTSIGADLHRTPFGGRTGEYLSECPNFTALIGEVMAEEMTARGYAGGPKHFVGNDQETARGGVSMFFTEQAFREGALRGFEGSLGWGGSRYTMQSMGRIGLYYIPASYALNTKVLRDEWGFVGFVMTDGVLSPYGQEYLSQITAGTENICLSTRLDLDPVSGVSRPGYQYIDAIKAGDGNILAHLRKLTKNVHYTLAHTLAINGLSFSAKMVSITPWWKTALIIIDVLFALATLFFLAVLILKEFYQRQRRQAQ
ncbi:MAG: glycoside hydrolase family 3 C-terminal domain-containing protein [Clostridiales bacterium]|jgi:beta-glucosidase|nr:glycoside hydrolase family 3 C-terminal domain-containing protein [Clostridiales bacterium]